MNRQWHHSNLSAQLFYFLACRELPVSQPSFIRGAPDHPFLFFPLASSQVPAQAPHKRFLKLEQGSSWRPSPSRASSHSSTSRTSCSSSCTSCSSFTKKMHKFSFIQVLMTFTGSAENSLLWYSNPWKADTKVIFWAFSHRTCLPLVSKFPEPLHMLFLVPGVPIPTFSIWPAPTFPSGLSFPMSPLGSLPRFPQPSLMSPQYLFEYVTWEVTGFWGIVTFSDPFWHLPTSSWNRHKQHFLIRTINSGNKHGWSPQEKEGGRRRQAVVPPLACNHLRNTCVHLAPPFSESRMLTW